MEGCTAPAPINHRGFWQLEGDRLRAGCFCGWRSEHTRRVYPLDQEAVQELREHRATHAVVRRVEVAH